MNKCSAAGLPEGPAPGQGPEPESARRICKGVVTMKNKIKSSKQQGQAIMEMCVCLIPILAILLGMIFIAGLSISNIRMFIRAKGNAEILSRSDNMVGGAGASIHHWDYGDGEDGDGYPFTADDRIVDFYRAGAESGVETLINEQLNGPEYSYSESPDIEEGDEYVFMPTALLRADNNFARDLPGTMLAAAELVEGMADSDLNKVFTIDSRYFSNGEIKKFNFSFTYLFGIYIDDIDLRNMRANTVYYPALPAQQAEN